MNRYIGHHAAGSEWVEKEAEYALTRRRRTQGYEALWLPGMGGPSLLDRAHALQPGAVRALLVKMGDAAAMSRVKLASGRGQADLWILHGWESPEEWLYPQVQQALSTWSVAHRARCRSTRSPPRGRRG